MMTRHADEYEFLAYLRRNVWSTLSRQQGLLSIHSLSGDISDPHLWLWLDREKRSVCFASPETKLSDRMTEWALREPTQIRIRDRVRVGTVIVDTSALIDGLVSKLVENGLLKDAKIGIPAIVTLELQRLEEAGKRRGDKELNEKSRSGVDEISRLKRLADVEGVIELNLDLGESVDSSLPMESVARSAIADKTIRKVANETKSLFKRHGPVY